MGIDFLVFTGNDENDTSVYLNKLCTAGKNVLGWIDTHVRGTPVGFSSVDCHTQYMFDKFMFAGIKGFVVEIPFGKMEYYILSNLKKKQYRKFSQM